MKITKNFLKGISGGVLLMLGYDMVLSAVADSNRQFGYHCGKVDGFSEGCKYARRRGINNENKDNSGSENKD